MYRYKKNQAHASYEIFVAKKLKLIRKENYSPVTLFGLDALNTKRNLLEISYLELNCMSLKIDG